MHTTAEHVPAHTGLNSLETVVILLVLLAFALEAVVPIAVVAATLAAVAHIEAGVHLWEGVHAQNLVDLTERQQPQRKLPKHRGRTRSFSSAGTAPTT